MIGQTDSTLTVSVTPNYILSAVGIIAVEFPEYYT